MKRQAFTLVEMIIVVAIISISAAAAWPMLPGFRHIDKLRDSAGNVVMAARRAQSMAASGYMGKAWGIKIFSDRVVIFSGDSYTTRNISNDQSISLEKDVIAQLGEFDFDKSSGYTNAGTINFTAGSNTAQILISRLGLIRLGSVN